MFKLCINLYLSLTNKASVNTNPKEENFIFTLK